jgi:hypothetical protein
VKASSGYQVGTTIIRLERTQQEQTVSKTAMQTGADWQSS